MEAADTNQEPPAEAGPTPALQALVDVTRAIAAEPEPARALWILVCALREDLLLDRAGVFAFDPSRDTLQRIVGVDREGQAELVGDPITVSAGRSPLCEVIRRERPYYFTDDAPRDYPNEEFVPGVKAHAIIPIIAGGALLGAICVDNCLTGRPIPISLLNSLFLYAGQAVLPLFALYHKREAERAEGLRRHILREVISAVTGGRVELCDHRNIETEWPTLESVIPIQQPADVREVRERARSAGRSAGMDAEREWNLGLCVSEAATNALVHGSGGVASIGQVESRVRVRITDRGRGIPLDELPDATLRPGWSKGVLPSMGQGFVLIHKLADRVFLSTGPEGTTVIIEMDANPQVVLPEAWAALL